MAGKVAAVMDVATVEVMDEAEARDPMEEMIPEGSQAASQAAGPAVRRKMANVATPTAHQIAAQTVAPIAATDVAAPVVGAEIRCNREIAAQTVEAIEVRVFKVALVEEMPNPDQNPDPKDQQNEPQTTAPKAAAMNAAQAADINRQLAERMSPLTQIQTHPHHTWVMMPVSRVRIVKAGGVGGMGEAGEVAGSVAAVVAAAVAVPVAVPEMPKAGVVGMVVGVGGVGEVVRVVAEDEVREEAT